jgi:hypothetical protein
MLRVSAFIVSQVADVYTVEAYAEGVAAKFTFDITAKSEDEAAMEAIRRVETFESATKHKEGTH